MTMITNTNNPLDQLEFSNDPSITKALDCDEAIILSTTVYKYNMNLKRQERGLLITSKAIYNIKKDFFGKVLSVFSKRFKIRRRIEISKLSAITVSKESSEFVLHVASEYDYRYASPQKRDDILIAIYMANDFCVRTEPLLIFWKEDINLMRFTTTERDKKNKICKMPKDEAIIVDVNGLKAMIKKSKQMKEDERKNTQTVFSSDSKAQQVSLDDFEILKVIGRGTLGKVMLVEKKDTKKLYAMKSMRKQDLVNNDQIEHIKAERYILGKNGSPFMVNLEYAFHTPEKLFFVMTFMQGGELFQHLRACRRFDEGRAKFYAAEVIMALEYLHENGFAYRDLKPENILMDEEGHVRLADFGLAKFIKKGELTKSFVGTPDYLAPEILLETGHGNLVDWWALGILIFEMLIGIPPFYNKEQNIHKIAHDIANKDVSFGTKIKVSLEARDLVLRVHSTLLKPLLILSKLLNKDAKKRLGSRGAAEVKAHPWFKDIDWSKIAVKKIVPPFKPNISDECDVKNFSEEFTTEEAKSSVILGMNTSLVRRYNKEFEEMNFTAPNTLLNNLNN